MRVLALATFLAVSLHPLRGETKQPQPRRMVGGQVIATVTEVPFVVLVGNGLKTCLGTLLTPKWILTAAHCVDGASFLEVAHLSGESVYGFVNTDERADRFRWGVLFHPDYDPLKGEASTKDIALIEMSESLTSRYVRPVELPSESHIAQIQNGLNVTVLGLEPSNLVRAEWPLTPCDNPEDWTVCAQMSMSQHVEPGDSGGAVLMRDGEDWVLVGTTFYSYGAGGQLAAQRTSYYLPWIAQYVGDEPDGPGTSSSPQAVEVALGSSGSTVTLMTTQAGGFTLDGEDFTGGDVNAENGNTYTLSLVNGEWRATFVPVVAEVRLGASGDMLTITMLEDRTYEAGGEALMEGDARAAMNGNVYSLSIVDGAWMATYEPALVSIDLGTSGASVTLSRAEDGSYRYGNERIQSGSVITAANGSRYRLTFENGTWTATFVSGSPVPDASPRVTITLQNGTPSSCSIEDLLTTAGASSAEPGKSVDVQVQGQVFRTVLLVECGQP